MALFKGTSYKNNVKTAMDYVLKPEKAVIVSSQFLNNEEDYSKQMQATAHRFGKNRGTNDRQYYSFVTVCIQSFWYLLW